MATTNPLIPEITAPFQEQIDFFRQKLNVPTASWKDLQRSAHDQAFTVAGATSIELLQDLRNLVDIFISGRQSLPKVPGSTIDDYEKFRDEFLKIVKRHGWTGWKGEVDEDGQLWRARVIAETNLDTSYAAGRWQQIQETKSLMGYLQYVHSGVSLRPRPAHVAWSGTILPVDHPWWQTHYPPNGFGCKCVTQTLSARSMRRRDLKVTDDDAIPDGTPDKGWDYVPGGTWRPDLAKLPETMAAAASNFIDKNTGGNGGKDTSDSKGSDGNIKKTRRKIKKT